MVMLRLGPTGLCICTGPYDPYVKIHENKLSGHLGGGTGRDRMVKNLGKLCMCTAGV